MGCIGSHLSEVITFSGSRGGGGTGDRRRTSTFHVLNVDELGRHLSPGKLEVSDEDLILHTSGKPPLTWPLKSLRRYGYESDLFSFESGRRCPTGPGIYAFKCSKAQTLFELLQSRITSSSHIPILPPSTRDREPNPRSPSHAPGSLYSNLNTTNHANVSPLSMSPTFDYVNIPTDRTGLTTSSIEYANNIPLSGTDSGPLYMNVDNPATPTIIANGNIRPKPRSSLGTTLSGERPNLMTKRESGPGPGVYTSIPSNNPETMVPEVNYAELDLETLSVPPCHNSPSNRNYGGHGVQQSLNSSSTTKTQILSETTTSGNTTITSESMTKTSESLGYATIDFNRTAALMSVVTRSSRIQKKNVWSTLSSSTERDEDDEFTASIPHAPSTISGTSNMVTRRTRHNSTAL